METSQILNKEEKMAGCILGLIPKIVDIRLDLQDALACSEIRKADFEAIVEELTEAVDNIYAAEKSMGSAHTYLVVSQATLRHYAEDDSEILSTASIESTSDCDIKYNVDRQV